MINYCKKEILIIIFLLIIATFPRIIFLDKIPPGIHGDEGWTGIDARIILEKGYIEPYVGSALGQPTGPLYVTAFLFKFFGQSIFILRLSMAIFGILTVPLFYILLRIFTKRKSAFLTTVAFNFSLLHLTYSRIAFMLISAPFFQVLALSFFFLSQKTKRQSLLILSAIFTGLGMYSYNAFILFPIPFFSFLFFEVFRKKTIYEVKKFLLFSLFFLSIFFPLLRIIITKPDFYFAHHRLYSILNKPEVKQEKRPMPKFRNILINGINNTKYFFMGGKIDYGDSLGYYQSFNKPYLILFFLGLIITLIRKKFFLDFFLFSMSFFIIGNFLTFDGVYRRQILNLINFFYFVNISIDYFMQKFKRNNQYLLFMVFFLLILFLSIKNLKSYFNYFSSHSDAKFVFTYDLTKTLLKLKSIYKTNTPVYFYSSRWGCNYETIRFIIPQLICFDQSKEFGGDSEKFINCQNCFYVLLNNYLLFIENIKKICPNGKEIKIFDEDKNMIIGIIYYIE